MYIRGGGGIYSREEAYNLRLTVASDNCFTVRLPFSFSHRSPWNLSVQTHLNLSPVSSHIPSFRHGFFSQGPGVECELFSVCDLVQRFLTRAKALVLSQYCEALKTVKTTPPKRVRVFVVLRALQI